MEKVRMVFDAVDKYVRPLSFPVAVKLIEPDEIPSDARTPVKTFGYRMALCQGIALARRFGWKIAYGVKDWGCSPGMACFGFGDTPDPEIEAEVACPLYTSTPQAGVTLQSAMPRLPVGTGKTILLAGHSRTDFEPDVIIIYGEPFQIARCIHGAIWEDGQVISSEFAGRIACAYEIVRPIITGNCQVVVPGGGERAFAGTQDHEMSFAVPKNRFESFARGLEKTHQSGANRIPTPLLSVRMKPEIPKQYDNLSRKLGIKE